jgi:very-short-patch-repair endonuclease
MLHGAHRGAMRDDLPTAARRLAARQHGVVAVRQLRALGLNRHQRRNLTGPHGRWEAMTDEVLRLHGTSPSPEQRTMAAVLDAGPGARLSFLPGGQWWGLHGSSQEVLVARTGSSRRDSSLATVHRVRFLPDRWTTVHRGVPIARPELIALHLFATDHVERAERRVDRLWSMRLLSGGSLARFLADIPLRGSRGSAALRRYFDQRGPSYRPPDSGLESRFDQIARGAGLVFRRQVDTGDDQHWTGRVDFLHTTLPLVVELQSEAYHSSLVDRRADQRRIASLEAAGFVVVEITDTMVWTSPDEVLARLRHGVELCRRLRQQ